MSVCAVLSVSSVLVTSSGCQLLCAFLGIGCPVTPACTTDADCTEDGLGMCLVDAEGDGICVECLASSDCSDGDTCTTDTCGDDNACSSAAVECADDELCDPSDGSCVDCLTDDDCDDGDVCTDNDCELACTDAESCDDANTCTTDVCDTDTGQCSNDDVSCPDQICNPADGLCVDCLTDADCDADEDCTDNVCRTEVTGFVVTIDGCPTGTVGDGDVINLEAMVFNATAGGQLTFTWRLNGAGTITGDDDATPETVTFTAGASDATVDVSVQDNTVTPGTVAVVSATVCTDAAADCPDGDTCNTDGFCETPGTADVVSPTGTPATDDCTVDVLTVQAISVNAGADTAANVAFPSGGTIAVGTLAAPVTFAIADDPGFDDIEIDFFWEAISGPTGVNVATDIVIVNTSSTGLAYRLLPVASAAVPVMQPTGLTSTQTNTAIPGQYCFRVTITNPSGLTATDEFCDTQLPAWDADSAAAGGAINGMAATNGALTDYVATGSSINLAFSAMIPIDGTVQFGLEDQSATPDPDILLNAVQVVGSGTAQTVTAEVTGVATPGSYDVEAGFNELTGLVSVAPSAAAGTTQYNVHIQRVPLPATIDPDNLLLIDSNAGSSVHGGDDDTAGDFAGIIDAHAADIDGDGRQELLTMTAAGVITAIWLHPDPTTASPFFNGGLQDGEWDNAADANLTATVQVTANNAGDAKKFTLCDIDGDADLDIVIAAPGGTGAGAADGEAEVWKQDVTGTIAFAGDRYDATRDHDIQTAADADNVLGYALACGNVGGNTVADIVLGVPSTNFGGTGEAGAVGVFFGGAGAFGGAPGTTTVTIGTGAGANVWIHEPDGASGENDLFGIDVCLGESSGAAPLDIHIGCPGCETDDNGDGVVDAGEDAEGAVFIVNGGGPTGVVTTFDARYDGDSTEMLLGRRLVCGDFDNDGRDDVFASFAGDLTVATSTGGAVLIRPSQASGTVANTTNFPRVTGSNTGDNLCAEMAMGDVNNDGVGDLACTMPEDSDEDGQVRVYYGGTTPNLSVDLTFDPVEIALAVDAGILAEGAADFDLVVINGDAGAEASLDHIGAERWIVIMDLDLNGANDLLFKTDGAGGADTGEVHYLLQPNGTQVLLVTP
ncbi:MAG: hypothetical protein V3W34_17600 [Phycisphaerae bacterium]